MGVRWILKQLAPPLITSIYQKYKNGFAGRYIWKGVYQKFEAVPVVGDNYFSKSLASEAFEYTKSLLNHLASQKTIPYHVTEENSFLPLLAALVLNKKKKLNVLDLGGGTGVGFVSLLSCLDSKVEVKYLVIETPAMCDQGARLFVGDNRISFISDFPDSLPDLDIVFVNSALQYFERYREVLLKLASYKPDFFLFVKLSAGHINTFATAQQNLRKTTSPYWFFGIAEIIEIMASSGYSLSYKSALSRIYDQSNLPQQYRVDRACNLLFIKTTKPDVNIA